MKEKKLSSHSLLSNNSKSTSKFGGLSLTNDNIAAANEENGYDRLKDTSEFQETFKDQLRERALKIYRHELNCPSSIDLGLHGVTRAALRTLCKEAVLESSKVMKRRYSHSGLSSSVHSSAIQDNNAVSALKMLQKERLIVSRLGFADRAMEIDKEIEVMRQRAKKAREEEEHEIIEKRMKVLHMAQRRKEQRLEYILAEETRQMNERFKKEEDKMLKRQEQEFLRVLENASRRAIGRVKKCNCETPYTCRHNKTASYNTRRPSYLVIKYRRNAKRLKQAGRPEEAAIWTEKAKEIDEQEQEKWRSHIAESIVSSPWGANEAAVDQITELHKKELAVLRKTHDVKRDMHKKKQAMRRKNFRNTMLAEERKVRMQCRKLLLLRVRKDFSKEQAEIKREKSFLGHSDGLKNVSKNLLGEDIDLEEKRQVDWVPPTTFGLDNSVRLIDAVKQINPNAVLQTESGELQGRIFTTRKDMAELSAEQLRQKIHSVLKEDNSDIDSESDEDGGDENEEEDLVYKLGLTSGSKLVDKMRVQSDKIGGKEKAPNTPSEVSDSTKVVGWANSSQFGSGFGVATPQSNVGVPQSPVPFQSQFITQSQSPFASPFPSSFPLGGGAFPWNHSANSFNGASFVNPFVPSGSNIQSNSGKTENSVVQPLVTTPIKPSVPSSPAPSTHSFRAGLHINIHADATNIANGSLIQQKKIPESFPTMAPPSGDESSIFVQQNIPTSPRTHLARLQSTSGEDFQHRELVQSTVDVPIDEPGEHHIDDIDIHHRDSEDSDSGGAPSPKNLVAQKWKFDPIEDNKPISFKPGSLSDADWQRHDEELVKIGGIENSYGISLLLNESKNKQRPKNVDAPTKALTISGGAAKTEALPTIQEIAVENSVELKPVLRSADGNATDISPFNLASGVVASVNVAPFGSNSPFSAPGSTNLIATQSSIVNGNSFAVGMSMVTPISVSSVVPDHGLVSPVASDVVKVPAPTKVPSVAGSTITSLTAVAESPKFEGNMYSSECFKYAHVPLNFKDPNNVPSRGCLLSKSNYNNKKGSTVYQKRNPRSMLPIPAVPSASGGNKKKSVRFSDAFVVEVEKFDYREEDFAPTPTLTEIAKILSMPLTGDEDEPIDVNQPLIKAGSLDNEEKHYISHRKNSFTEGLVPSAGKSSFDLSTNPEIAAAAEQVRRAIDVDHFYVKVNEDMAGRSDALNNEVENVSKGFEELSINQHSDLTGKQVTATLEKFPINQNIGTALPPLSGFNGFSDGPSLNPSQQPWMSPATLNNIFTPNSGFVAQSVPNPFSTLQAVTTNICGAPVNIGVVPHQPPSNTKPSEAHRPSRKFHEHGSPTKSIGDVDTNHQMTYEKVQEDIISEGCSQVPFTATGFNAQWNVPNFSNMKNQLPSSTIDQPGDILPAAIVSDRKLVESRDSKDDMPRKDLFGEEDPQFQRNRDCVIELSPRGQSPASIALDGFDTDNERSRSSSPTPGSQMRFLDASMQLPQVAANTATNATSGMIKTMPVNPTFSNQVSFHAPDFSGFAVPSFSSTPFNNNSSSFAQNENATGLKGTAAISNLSTNESMTSGFHNNHSTSFSGFALPTFPPPSSLGSPWGQLGTPPVSYNPFPTSSQTPVFSQNTILQPLSSPQDGVDGKTVANPPQRINVTRSISIDAVPGSCTPSGTVATQKGVDLSIEYTDSRSYSTDESAFRQYQGPNWELSFFRLHMLNNLVESVEAILKDDDLFDCAELFLTTSNTFDDDPDDHNHNYENKYGKKSASHHQKKKSHGKSLGGTGNQDVPESDDGANLAGLNFGLSSETHRDRLLARLQMVRGWKKYEQDHHDIELLVMTMEDVLELYHDDIMENLDEIVAKHTKHFQILMEQIAWIFVPTFILSQEFASYYDSHSTIKSHNKRLKTDSKSWIGKFQKTVSNHSFPIHLFPFQNVNGRPYANLKMRELFGPMCDAPTPKEYLDLSSTPEPVVRDVLEAMKTGRNGLFHVFCRTLRNDYRPEMMLAMKHLKSSKNPEEFKFTMIVLQDFTVPNSRERLKLLETVMRCIPSDDFGSGESNVSHTPQKR